MGVQNGCLNDEPLLGRVQKRSDHKEHHDDMGGVMNIE